MTDQKRCGECGAALTAEAPQGLCPACLLKRGFDTGSVPTDAGTPPSPAELGTRFPELEITGFIGRGGMGAVYKARQKRLDRLVALKILPPSVSADPAFADRFEREAKALAKLHHQNIVTLYEFGQADGLFYFLMEFVDGMNLRQLLNAGKLAPKEALAIVPQICDALQFAHDRGIVHRDIKPENVLLGKDGQVKIADFGVAKIVGTGIAETTSTGTVVMPAAQLTEADRVIGTPQYMAPEQRDHPATVDHRADIYSLGVVFYQMLTGELPGKKIEPPSHKVLIDVRLDEVVLRALEKEPERRYSHASDVKTMVETIVAEAGNAAPPKIPTVWMSPKSGWGVWVGRMFNITFTSRKAYACANLSALGFLGCLGFLGYLPLAGSQHLFGLFSLFGFFGLMGAAAKLERRDRRVAETEKRADAGQPSGYFVEPAKDDSVFRSRAAQIFGVVTAVVIPLLMVTGSAKVMMIGSGVLFLVGLIWFPRKWRLALLVGLAAVGIATWTVIAIMKVTRRSSPATIPSAQSAEGINRVSVDGNKVIIEGTATTGARLAFYAGRRNNGWSCGFNYPDQFTATLEQGWPGALSCRVQPRLGKPVLTMNWTQAIGEMKLSEGKLVFRAGQPQREADGVWSATIGEFTANSGEKTTVGVLLLPPRPEDLLPHQLAQEGWQLWQAGKMAKAAEKFHEAIRLAPTDANAWNGLGWAQFNDGDSTLAEQSFQVAIGIEPNQPGALNGLGQLYLSQRKYAEAEKYLLQAAPQAPAAWFGLARLYLLLGKFEQAEIWARKIVDAGQADELTLKMLEAARERNLSEDLRRQVEPPPAGSVK